MNAILSLMNPFILLMIALISLMNAFLRSSVAVFPLMNALAALVDRPKLSARSAYALQA